MANPVIPASVTVMLLPVTTLRPAIATINIVNVPANADSARLTPSSSIVERTFRAPDNTRIEPAIVAIARTLVSIPLSLPYLLTSAIAPKTATIAPTPILTNPNVDTSLSLSMVDSSLSDSAKIPIAPAILTIELADNFSWNPNMESAISLNTSGRFPSFSNASPIFLIKSLPFDWKSNNPFIITPNPANKPPLIKFSVENTSPKVSLILFFQPSINSWNPCRLLFAFTIKS